MMHSLLVVAAIATPGAPIPKDTLPNPIGPAPRVLAVKANVGGGVTIIAIVYEKRKIQQQFFVMENGKQVLKQQETEIMTSTYIHKNLGDFGGKFTTADGADITSEQAIRRVKEGATILITADGKPIDPSWLRAVGGDTVVMHTNELGQAQFQYGHSSLPNTPNPRLVMLGTDEKGNVRIPVNTNGNNLNNAYYDEFGGFNNVRFRAVAGGRVFMNGDVGNFGGDASAAPATKPAGPDGKKPLEDIRFDAYDLNGKLIPKADAMKRLKAGGLALFAGDNRFPDPEYLKAFRDDLIVLVSAEFVFPPGIPNPYDTPVKPAPAAKQAALIAPVPALAPAALIPAQAIPVPAVKVQAPPAVVQKKEEPVVQKKEEAPPAREKVNEKPAEKAKEKTDAAPVKP
jgi:hypothetical protein